MPPTPEEMLRDSADVVWDAYQRGLTDGFRRGKREGLEQGLAMAEDWRATKVARPATTAGESE